MTGPALNREEISLLIHSDPPLIAGAPDLPNQLQPNGFDLTLAHLETFDSQATIFPARSQAQLPDRSPIHLHPGRPPELSPGTYLVTFTETITMPPDLIGLVRPRSSLLRCGAALHTGVWDAGYSGQSQALLQVLNPNGITLHPQARIGHMIFIRMGTPPLTPYQGRYQGEAMAHDAQ